MKIQIKAAKNLQQKTDCLVVALKPLKKIASQQAEINTTTDGALDRLQTGGQFSADQGEVASISVPAGLQAGHLVALGVGNEKSLNTETIREILSGLASKVKALKAESVTCDLQALVAKSDIETVSRQLVEAFGDQEYQYLSLIHI